MADAGSRDTEPQPGHILLIGLVGLEKLSSDERAKAIEELERMMEDTVRFRVADVARKVVRQLTDNGLLVAFFSDPAAPLECAVEIAHKLRNRADLRLRAAIHSDRITYDAERADKSEIGGEGIDVAQRILSFGDAGHILLSKRTAFELASNPRWGEHFYELGDFQTTDKKISLVNFYTDEIGNSELPAKIKRAQQELVLRAKLKSLRRPILVAIVVSLLALAIAGGYVFVRQNVTEPVVRAVPAIEKSIAVLPFVDLSSAHDQEYLSDGISEEILDAVAKLKGLRAVGRASAFAFKNRNLDPNEIGRRLNVETIVQGSVRRDQNWIRIAVQLSNSRDSSQLWSKTFERDVREVSEIEDEVTRAISNVLKVGPPLPARARIWDDPLTNDLYLQGLFLSHKHGEEELRSSLDFFRLALAKNPRLSRALVGTAKDWIRLSEHDYVRPIDAYFAAQKAVDAALAIDRRDPELLAYSGEIKRVLSWDLKGDEAELKRALELNSHSTVAHLFTASLKTWLGTPNESFAHIRAALYFDPFSPFVGHTEVIVDVASDRLNEALAAAQRMMENDPNYTYFEPDLALVYREQGKLSEALDIYSRLEKTRPQPGLAITYVRLNRQDDARNVLADLIELSKDSYVAADEIAAVYVALGERDRAFQWLNRAVGEHSATLHDLGYSRNFLPLRSDPRYPELLRRIGLEPKRFPPR